MKNTAITVEKLKAKCKLPYITRLINNWKFNFLHSSCFVNQSCSKSELSLKRKRNYTSVELIMKTFQYVSSLIDKLKTGVEN